MCEPLAQRLRTDGTARGEPLPGRRKHACTSPVIARPGHEGDGVYATRARLGSEKRLDRESDDENGRYTISADQTDQQKPDSMPEADLTTFYPACDAGDGTR
ncbi:hypothetical protein ACWD6R_05065 [Streptomyces sp. NPDC005151]